MFAFAITLLILAIRVPHPPRDVFDLRPRRPYRDLAEPPLSDGWGSTSANHQVIAVAFYGVAATVGSLVFNLLWWYGAYAANLTLPALTAHKRRAHTIAWGPAPFVAAILTAVASPARYWQRWRRSQSSNRAKAER